MSNVPLPESLTSDQEKALLAEAKTGPFRHTTPSYGNDMQSGETPRLSSKRHAGSTPPTAPAPDGMVMVPQTLVSQLQDALEVAEAGLLWYQDANPDQVSECDAETMAEIAAAIAAAPPAVPAPAVPDDFCGNLDSPHDSGDTKYCDVSEKTVDYATEALERLAAAAPAVREPQPFTKAQLHRLYVNSPELHKDAPSEAAFTRIVQLAESAHGITGAGNG